MAWNSLTFGKHKGKNLPQILFSDPDWFFWAISNNVFDNKSASILSQAKDIYTKSTNIKIPDNIDDDLEVEYFIHSPSNKFSHFTIIPSSKPIHQGSSGTCRSPLIDMSIPKQIASYDKLGCKNLISSLKYYIFGNKSARLTQKKCEDFFDDDNNFA